MNIINKLVELGFDPVTAQSINFLTETDNATIIVGGIDTSLAEKTVKVLSQQYVDSPTPTTNQEEFKLAIDVALNASPDIVALGEIRNDEQAKILFDSASRGAKVFAPLRCSSALGAFSRLNALGIPLNESCDMSQGITAIIYNVPIKRMCPHCSKRVSELRAHLNEEQTSELEALCQRFHPLIDKERFDNLAIPTGKPCLHHQKYHVFTKILLLNNKLKSLIKSKDEFISKSLTESEWLMVFDIYSDESIMDLMGNKLETIHSNNHGVRVKELCELGEIELMEAIEKA